MNTGSVNNIFFVYIKFILLLLFVVVGKGGEYLDGLSWRISYVWLEVDWKGMGYYLYECE